MAENEFRLVAEFPIAVAPGRTRLIGTIDAGETLAIATLEPGAKQPVLEAQSSYKDAFALAAAVLSGNTAAVTKPDALRILAATLVLLDNEAASSEEE